MLPPNYSVKEPHVRYEVNVHITIMALNPITLNKLFSFLPALSRKTYRYAVRVGNFFSGNLHLHRSLVV